MPPSLSREEFFRHMESIPPFPAVAQRVLMVTESPDSSAQDVARVLREDPVIAAKILRVANSPFYGASREITEVSRAVMRLGAMAVRNLVLGLCARQALSVNPLGVPEHRSLWRHSIAAASACELVAQRAGFQLVEEAFVAGLLHDTGLLVMMLLHPDRFCSLRQETFSQTAFLKRECELFGVDHAEAGLQIMTRWGLPDSLCRIVRQHHASETELASASDRLLSIVVLGDILAHVVGAGLDRPVGPAIRAETAAQQLGLSDSELSQIVIKLEERVAAAVQMLGETCLDKPHVTAAASHTPVSWVSADDRIHSPISMTMLTQQGYMVGLTPYTQLTAAPPNGGLIVIDPPCGTEHASVDAASRLAVQGHRRIVLLHEPRPEGPLRYRETRTGICRIPRLFTAFDFNWAEKELQS